MKLKANLIFSHLNVRREKAGEEEGPVAIDIKLTGDVPIAALELLFGTAAGYVQLLENLYRDDNELVTNDLAGMRLNVEAENMEGRIIWGLSESNHLDFKKSKLNNISIVPKAGRIAEFTGRLQLNPQNGELAQYGKLLGEAVELDISPMQQALDLP